MCPLDSLSPINLLPLSTLHSQYCMLSLLKCKSAEMMTKQYDSQEQHQHQSRLSAIKELYKTNNNNIAVLFPVITALYSRVDLPSGKLMTLPRLNIVKRELPLKCGKSSLGSLASLQTFLYQNCVTFTSWAGVKDDTCMERCSWGRDRRYLVASILGTPGGAQAKVTSLVRRLIMWPS